MKCFGQKIRNYHCKVVLLDEQELIQEIQSSSNGQELLENVFKHLNIMETAYFGLRYIDHTEQTNWLDPGKKVIKQLEGTEPFTLYFGVKFYATDPCKLLEEITRYQFFLQIKQDILQGRLPVPFDLAAELCAYAVQSELGDYDPRRHCTGYISEFRFVSNQSTELESRITELHKSFSGQVPAVAELNYLEKVKWLEMYGVDLHPVLGEDHVDYFLGLTPSGIIVLRNKNKVGNYFWPRISKLNNKGKYFMIRVRNKSNEDQTYGFETPSRAACKHLWKCAVEHHAFFKLVQVAPSSVNAGNKQSTLSSRFRDSGRSESSVRRRAQPQFVRTPSRRYTRRVVEGGQDDSRQEETNVDSHPISGVSKTVSIPQPVSTNGTMYRTNSMAQMTRSDSPRSVRSAPWPAHIPAKTTSYSVPSPRSVRSAAVGGNSRERDRQRDYSKDRKRSASAESNSSVDSRSHRRRRHRSRKNSDNESEVSRSSGRSHHSKRRHKSSTRRDNSGSESENSHRHKHRHRHRHNSGKYELVDSEVQWKEAQKKQASIGNIQQTAVISSAKVVVPSVATQARKSGYMNSGLETESSEISFSNKKRHRRHRSKSPKERLPEELKKHIHVDLIDAPMVQPESIPYVKVETGTLKSSRIRYNPSMKSNRSNSQQQNNPPSNENSAPIKKPEFPSTGDSPPPPYTPPTASNSVVEKHNKQEIDSLSGRTSVKPMSSASSGPSSAKGVLKSSLNGKQLHHPSSSTYSCGNPGSSFAVPPPPSKVLASNMTKQFPGIDELNAAKLGSAGRQRKPIMLYGMEDAHDIHHPSPSESPDSQKVDSHHENSDSGLGTDHHEYYKSETFSSLGYTLPRRGAKDSLKTIAAQEQGSSDSSTGKYWNQVDARIGNNWLLGPPTNFMHMSSHPSDRRTMTLDRRTRTMPSCHDATTLPSEKFKRNIELPPILAPPTPFHNKPSLAHYHSGAQGPPPTSTNIIHTALSMQGGTQTLDRRGRSRSSSLEMILSPLVTSTRTRL